MKSINGVDSVKNSVTSNADNDDDDLVLEALRLAALESLRAKGLPPPPVKPATVQSVQQSPTVVYRQHNVNQNLISIVPIADVVIKQEVGPKPVPATNSLESKAPSLPASEDEDKPKVSSKFSRYEDSESEDSDDFDVELKTADEDSESECELEIGETEGEDLLLRSPTPPGASCESKSVIQEKGAATQPTHVEKNKKSSDATKSQSTRSKPTSSLRESKSRSTTDRSSRRQKVPEASKSSRHLSPRHRPQTTSRQKSPRRRSPVRSLKRKESQQRHRSQKPSPVSPSPLRERPSSAVAKTCDKVPEEKRRSRSRSPFRSRKVSPIKTDTVRPSKLQKAELDKLEARKRKFEGDVELQPRKIKLSSEPEAKPVEKKDEKRKHSSSTEQKPKESSKAAPESNKDSSDLRAELQRRRINRELAKDAPQSNTKEGVPSDSRRILVIKSKIAAPEQEAGKTSIRKRLGDDPVVQKRIKLKRPVSSAAAVDADQGTCTGSSQVETLEDRIRRIQAMNDAIRQRHRELETDKMLFT